MSTHNTQTGHPIAFSFADFSYWCYSCNSYVVHEILNHGAVGSAFYVQKFGHTMDDSEVLAKIEATKYVSPNTQDELNKQMEDLTLGGHDSDHEADHEGHTPEEETKGDHKPAAKKKRKKKAAASTETTKMTLRSRIQEFKDQQNKLGKRCAPKILLVKPRVGVVFDEQMLLHKSHSEHHPERPERAMAIYLNLIKKGYVSLSKAIASTKT